MISAIFGKTRPINFIFIIAYVTLFFIGIHIFQIGAEVHFFSILKLFGILSLILFSVFLSNFLAKKNGLTKDNTFVILLFVLILSFYPYNFNNSNIIISNIFVLLALRRILSLKSYYHIKLKIFDASLWICIATIFYGWAILFFFLIFVAVLHYGLRDFRNWMVPFLAVFLVTFMVFSFYYLNDRQEEFYSVLDFSVKLNVEKYGDFKYLIPFLYILLIGGLGIFSYFANIKAKLSEQQSSILLVIVAFFISLFIALLSSNKNTSEFVFIAFPLSVIATNYIENIHRAWYKELLLWTFLAMPFFILML